MSPSHTARRLGVTLLCVMVLPVGWLAPPAGAHSEDGIMEIITVTSPAPLEIDVEVGIVYANDDDPAPDATVSVTATDGGGASVGPIAVPNRNDGVYATTFSVPTPGAWSIAVTATGPAADATGAVEVTDATTTSAPTTEATSAPTTTTDDDTTTTGATGSSTSPDSSSPPTTSDPDDDAEDDDSNVLPVVLIALLAVAAIVAVVVLARRSTAASDATELPTDEPKADGSGDPTAEEPGPDTGGDGS